MIAIVGGGITGLLLSYHLDARGVPHTVLEAEARPGGVIRSGRVDGLLLEWGPQRARLTDGLRRLIADLGLEDDVILAPSGLPLWVWAGGKLRRVPFSAGEFLRSDIASPAGKARLLLEPLTSGAVPDERVATYFTRKVGRELYENLIGPLYGGLYGSDPADMVVRLSLGHVLREFDVGRSLVLPLLRRGGRVDPPPACSFQDGMQMLPDALYRRCREHVRLATPVRGLERRGGAWRLRLDAGELEAEQVVLACPAPVVAGLLRDAAPVAAERIGRLRYNPLGVVHLHADTELRGLGYQVSFAETLATRGVTFNDSLFGRRGVYTVYLGGAKRPEVVAEPDEKLAGIA
ncbi:MAG TPA: protoporphyrinogen oxidase, partial [Longimicrobiales bacterium]|nr:protoporphyrinogen oxidase [Longimicrobiales bacterium]